MKTALKLLVTLNLLTPLMQHAIAQTTLPTATISGNTSVCQNTISPVITFTGGNGTAPYTFYYAFSPGLGEQSVTSSGTNSSATIAVPTFSGGDVEYTLVSAATFEDFAQ
jgi:hypothetical protein